MLKHYIVTFSYVDGLYAFLFCFFFLIWISHQKIILIAHRIQFLLMFGTWRVFMLDSGWSSPQMSTQNGLPSHTHTDTRIHFTTCATLVKLLLWEPNHLTGVYIPEESSSHKKTCRLFIYIFIVTTYPSGFACPSFPSERTRQRAQAPPSAGPCLALRRWSSVR